MQARASAADRVYVNPFAPLVAVALGLLGGLLGVPEGLVQAFDPLKVLPAITFVFFVCLLLFMRRSRAKSELLVLFCLAWLRGSSVHVLGEPTFPRPAEHLELSVRGAAWPGAPCRVHVSTPRLQEVLTLELDHGPCSWVDGDVLLVSTEGPALRRDLGDRWRLRRPRAFLRDDRVMDMGASAEANAGRSGARVFLHALVRRRALAWQQTRGRPAEALTAAVALGHRNALDPEHRQRLRLSGLGHLLAVSGLHVGLLAWVVLLGARLAFGSSIRGLRLAWLCSAIPVLVFVFASGGSASALRAGLMALAFSTAGVLGRPGSRTFVLCASATVMLLVDPASVFDPGFQLSFVAMSCLLRGGSALSVQWRLTWGLGGLSLAHFGYINWLGGLLNLLAIPLFSLLVMPFALLAWILPEGWGSWALDLSRPASQFLLDLAQLGARVPPSGRDSACVALGALAVLWFLSWAWAKGSSFDATGPCDERLAQGKSAALALAWRPPGIAALALAWGIALTWPGAAGARMSWGRGGGPASIELELRDGRWCGGAMQLEGGEMSADLLRRGWYTMPREARRELLAQEPRLATEMLAGLPACRRSLEFSPRPSQPLLSCADFGRGCWMI